MNWYYPWPLTAWAGSLDGCCVVGDKIEDEVGIKGVRSITRSNLTPKSGHAPRDDPTSSRVVAI